MKTRNGHKEAPIFQSAFHFASQMESVDADGKLAKVLDNHIAGIIYSMVGQSSPHSQIRYQLELAHNSLRDLHRQLKDLQHKCHGLEYKHAKAKEEASLNAMALKRRIVEYEALRERFEQLSKESDLYRRDIEVFSEAAEDAEERREAAEKRAVEAEKRAADVQRKLEAALVFVEELLRDVPSLHDPGTETKERSLESNPCICSSNERIESPTFERDASCLGTSPLSASSVNRLSGTAGQQDNSGQGPDEREKESYSSRKVLEEANHNVDNTTFLRKNSLLSDGVHVNSIGRNNLECDKCKNFSNNSSEIHDKENTSFEEIGGRSMRQAAESEKISPEIRRLIRLVNVGKNNLLKAELEADIIQARNWELQKLLLDIIATFGIFHHENYSKDLS